MNEGKDTALVLADALEEHGQAETAQHVRWDYVPRWGGPALWPNDLSERFSWDATSEAIHACCVLAHSLAGDDNESPRQLDWRQLTATAEQVARRADPRTSRELRAQADSLAEPLAPGARAGRPDVAEVLAHCMLSAIANIAEVLADVMEDELAEAAQQHGQPEGGHL